VDVFSGHGAIGDLSSISLMDLLHQEKWQVKVWPALTNYLLVTLMASLHLVCSLTQDAIHTAGLLFFYSLGIFL
jgi:hypothetical protein